MKPRLSIVLAFTGLLGAGLLTSAQLVSAQQTPPGAPAKEEFKPSAADRAAFREARIAALHAGLALTPEQEKLWPPVETAIRDLGKLVAAHKEEMHAAREAAHDKDHHPDPIAWLKRRSEYLVEHGQALKKFADAAAPLYASLSEEQKHRLPVLLHAMRPHWGHHHFGEHFGGEHHRMGEGTDKEMWHHHSMMDHQ